MESFSALNYDRTYYRVLPNNILLRTLFVSIAKCKIFHKIITLMYTNRSRGNKNGNTFTAVNS